MPGFLEFLSREIERRLPGSLVGAVRPERQGDYSVARGCLIRAELEVEAGGEPQRAAA